ncbi:MAG TPA: ABC transporter substrate-binding protein [Bacillota bacterium]|nr:ABC transporter substrate-binding protein [Bacillota bacterium]
MKRIVFLMAVLMLVLILAAAGCGPAEENGGEEETGAPEEQRIISLMPSNTEILFALGLEDSIVGVTNFCNYPPELETAVAEGRIQRVGDAFNINEELVVSLEPTLVLLGYDTDASRSLEERLNNLGISTAIIYPSTVAQTLESILTLGELTGREEKAQELVADMEAALDEIKAATAGIADQDKPRVLMLLDLDSLYVAGPATLEDELITLAGGINVVEAAGYSQISEEIIVESGPDIILCSFPFSDRIYAEKESWKDIPAVAADKVYDLNADLINRPTPRLIEGLQQLLSILHPQN